MMPCELSYHVMWTTKNRLPLITGYNSTAIYDTILAEVERLGGTTHVLNGTDNHIHLVVTLPPTLILNDFIRQVKTSSATAATRQPYSEGFQWQREYAVITLSESDLPRIIEYVENQPTHHQENTLDDELETIDPD